MAADGAVMRLALKIDNGGETCVVVVDLPAPLDLMQARRLWEAERAFNELTPLRVHVSLVEGGLDGDPEVAPADQP